MGFYLTLLPRSFLPNSVVYVRARVVRIFHNESRFSVAVRVDKPDGVGWEQVCVPAESTYPESVIVVRPAPPAPSIDRLTDKLSGS